MRTTKRLLAGSAALATTFVLTACTGAGTPGAVAEPAAMAAPALAPASAPAAPPPPRTNTAASAASHGKVVSATLHGTTKPVSQPAAKDSGVPCPAAAASPGTSACADISAHQAWLLQGGKVIYGPVPMLPGLKSYPTPTGKFHVLSKVKNFWSTEFKAPMPNSVFFYPGDAFHSGSLSQYSHGCIHLSPGASLTFFDTLHVGDVVQVVP
ncbi:L,D-transpeptidase [Amycolatopsis sp. NPDC059021]|uniref:L,D-transpeptidase n=1 Tax=Amycolatopsis sp. NPDC059021 TaxID=3346704 RepID=UPI0036705D72